MKLSHLAVTIVIIIAVIVAAIITAFSLVTFASLDKAVQNSMTSELEYVRSSVNNIIQRTVSPAKTIASIVKQHKWTIRDLPQRSLASAQVGLFQNSLVNFSDAFELMSATLASSKDLFIFCYQTGRSKFDETTWSDCGAQYSADGERNIVFAPTWTGSNLTFIDITGGQPYNLTTVDLVEYQANGLEWQVGTASMTANDTETGRWSSVSVFYEPSTKITNLLMTFGVPTVFDSTTGFAVAGVNIDISARQLGVLLQSLVNKNNMLFIIDARKTLYYDGALIASSLPNSVLPAFDDATKSVFFPTSTPNGQVNGIMNRILAETGGFENLKTAKQDVVVPNHDGFVLVAAHIYAPGDFHWVVVSAVPRSYYYGSTLNTIGGTIGGGVALLVLASALIVYIMLEQQKLVDGSRQSVDIAQLVAKNLVLYNTDDAAIVLEKALQPTLQFAVDGETREEVNYASRDLVLALQQINENLTIYKPHLPEYVLPSNVLKNENELEDEPSNKYKSVDEEMNEHPASHASSTDNENSAKPNSRSRASASDANDKYRHDPNNPYVVHLPSNDDAASRHSNTNHNNKRGGTEINSSHAGGKETTVPIAKLALMRHSGDVVERVVFAHLNLSRANDLLFPSVLTVAKAATIRNVNKLIENILETATANDATVHCMIGDCILTTWNATSRVVHADVKAMRFVTTVDTLIKKDLHDLFLTQRAETAGDKVTAAESQPPAQQQQQLSPYVDPHRSVLSGGVVNGSAWCQLGGNSKRQQFTLLNFSEAKLLTTVTETGNKGNLVAVCRTVYQNCQHEFVFRGCGVHCLPGYEKILFMGTQDHSGTAAIVNVAAPRAANTTTKGRTMMAIPIYELCSRKNLSAADEWLYVVGDGSNTNTNANKKDGETASLEERKKSIVKEQQHQQQLANIFNDLVVEISRSNADVCNALLERICAFDDEAQFAPAYQNLKRLVRKMM